MLKRMIAALLTGGASGAAGAGGAAGAAGAAPAGIGQQLAQAYLGGKQGPLGMLGVQPGQERPRQAPGGLELPGMTPHGRGANMPAVPTLPPVAQTAQRMLTQSGGQPDPLTLRMLDSLYR